MRLPDPKTERLVVRLVRGLHGLRGTVRVEASPMTLSGGSHPGRVLHPEGSAQELKIAEASPVADGPGWWLRFVGLGGRSAVEHLRDVYLETQVTADDRAPGTWRWHELVGLAVRGSDGRQLGTIREVIVPAAPRSSSCAGRTARSTCRRSATSSSSSRRSAARSWSTWRCSSGGSVVDETSGTRPKAPRRRPGSRLRTAGPSIPPDAAPPEPA